MTVAAGLISASFIMDIAPEIADSEDVRSKISAILGILGGALLMVALQKAESKLGYDDHGRGSAWGLVGAACVEFFTASVFVGQSIKDGQGPSCLMLAAASIEAIIVSAAVSSSLKNRGKSTNVLTVSAFAISLSSVFGMIAGYRFRKFFSGSVELLLLGVTATVMMWMVVQEMLPNARRSLGTHKWLIPALWIGSTASGIGGKWLSDS